MNISGIGMYRGITSIERILDTMPEPEHSNERGLDHNKWGGYYTYSQPSAPTKKDSLWDETFQEVCGRDYQDICWFYSADGRKARGKK